MAAKDVKKKKPSAKKNEAAEDSEQSQLRTIISSVWSLDKFRKLQMLLTPEPVLTEDRKKYFDGAFNNTLAEKLLVKELEDFKANLNNEASKISDPVQQDLVRTYIDYAIRGNTANKDYLILLKFWFYRPGKAPLLPAEQAKFWKDLPVKPTSLTPTQKQSLRDFSLHIWKNTNTMTIEDKTVVGNTLPVIGLDDNQVSALLDLKYKPGVVSCTGIQENGTKDNILDAKTPEFVFEVLELLLAMGMEEGMKYLNTAKGPGDITFCAPTMKVAQGKYNLMIESLVFQPKSGVSLYTCKRCGSQDVSVAQKQTKSADEPMTIACKCLSCENTWKDGG